ncbi:MAG: hypothetical protein ABJG68_08800 [Crocinitomicaceae bacterium]
MKILVYILVGLGAIFCIDLLTGGAIIPYGLLNGLADASGGKYTDIQGGLGTLFSGLGAVFAIIGRKKLGKPTFLIITLAGILLALITFFTAFSAVL